MAAPALRVPCLGYHFSTMECLFDKREGTKNNADFFNAMCRSETKFVSRVM